MKHKIIIILFLIIPFWAYATDNSNYVNNREPLTETPFIQLPLGSVTAEGWLLKQLELQRDGLTGHAEELYNGANDLGPQSDWLGNSGDSWERVPYYVKGLVPLAYLLNDQALISKAQKWIDWSLNNQTRIGFFGPQGNDDWWPRMPMLYAIRDYYEATNDERVIPFLTKYFIYQYDMINSKPLRDWGKSRAGDNIEIVFWLYNRTGDDFLLELADRLKNRAYDWTYIFTNNRFMDFGADFQPKHNVNIPQAMKMPVIYSQKSNNQTDIDAYRKGREHLMCDHGQPHGMQSGNEMIGGRSAMTGTELCSIVEQMQTSETVQMILGDSRIGDELEQVTFNALPGAMSKDIKGMQYYMQANQVQSKFGGGSFGQGYHNGLTPSPFSGYGCCRFNMHSGWPYYVKTLWAATDDNGLAAMAYAPSRVTAKVADNVEVTIIEDTNYPFEEELRFTVTTSQPVAFPLKLRVPGWCKNPAIKINGVAQAGVKQGEFYTINRTWNNNDVVVLDVPMEIRLSEEVNNSVSVHRGPLVFSLKMEERWVAHTDWGNGFKEYEIFPENAWNYGLAIDTEDLGNAFSVSKSVMPANPFVQSSTPVTLKVKAKKIPGWGYALNNQFACDPPFGPVSSSEPTEEITLVPFGAENIRLTCFPLIGTPNYISTVFEENFENDHLKGWVNYNGSFMLDNGEYLATNTEGYSGSKSVQTSTLFSNLIFDFKVKIGNTGDGGVIFRASELSLGADEYKGYYVGISAADQNVLLGKADGNWHFLTNTQMAIQANTWYQVRVEAIGAVIKVYVNDMNTPKITYADRSFSEGCIGVRCYNAITRWDNLRVADASNYIFQDLEDYQKLRGEILSSEPDDPWTPGATYTQSRLAFNAFDTNKDTYFRAKDERGGWIGLDLKNQYVIKKIRVFPRSDRPDRMLGCIFQGSNNADFSNSTDLFTVTQIPEANRFTTYDITSESTFRYVRCISPNDYCSISELEFYGEQGVQTVEYPQLTNLPTIYIETKGNFDFIDKKNYVSSKIVISNNSSLGAYNAQVRGRGNSSWLFMEKKSFRIKFDSKQRFLGLPANAKSWTLIACAVDKTFIRNGLAFDMSRFFDFEFSPGCVFVDVVLDGFYYGTYMASDHINVDKDRINIIEMSASDVGPTTITGGYHLEIDAYANEEPVYFWTNRGIPFTIQSPDEETIVPAQYEYIKNHINQLEDLLFRDPEKACEEYIDIESAVKYYLHSELTGNCDAYWCIPCYKKRGDDKLYFGPVWDFDQAFLTNERVSRFAATLDTQHGYAQPWFRIIMQTAAAQKVLARLWKKVKDENLQQRLLDYADKNAALLQQSQALNYQRWNSLNRKVWFEDALFNTYNEYIDFVKRFIVDRIAWFDDSYSSEIKDITHNSGKYNYLVRDGILFINQIENETPVKLYSIDGKLMKQQVAADSEVQISLPYRGIYLVSLSGETIKVKY